MIWFRWHIRPYSSGIPKSNHKMPQQWNRRSFKILSQILPFGPPHTTTSPNISIETKTAFHTKSLLTDVHVYSLRNEINLNVWENHSIFFLWQFRQINFFGCMSFTSRQSPKLLIYCLYQCVFICWCEAFVYQWNWFRLAGIAYFSTWLLRLLLSLSFAVDVCAHSVSSMVYLSNISPNVKRERDWNESTCIQPNECLFFSNSCRFFSLVFFWLRPFTFLSISK